MNAAATVGDTEFASPDILEPCSFVVLCDDPESRNAAMEICERLTTQFDGDLLFTFRCWKLKDFNSPALSEQITASLANADVIIFSTRGEDLPYPVRRCLEICPEQRTKEDGALGLLLVEPTSPTAAVGTVLSRLEYAAARLRMDFLPMLSAASGTFDDLEHRTSAVTSLLKGILEQPPSHWGLNE